MNTKIITERLIIEPVSLDYVEDMAEYACDVENAPYMIFLPYKSMANLIDYITVSINEWGKESPAFYEFSVVYDGKDIGRLSIYMSEDRSFGELGWIISKRYWRKGFAFEATKAVMKFAVEELGLDTLTAECDERNEPSYRLMEKLGFVLETKDSTRYYERTGETAKQRKYIWKLKES